MSLRITGLTVRYGAVTALDGLDLTIPPGELFVLLGGSGSGKTTLLRTLAGFVQADDGRIELDGTDLAALPPHRRPVNTMFQSYALFPHMSVAANIGFGLRQRGASRAETAARVTEMLRLVRLEGYGARRPHELSGGQQQRVALARSLAPNPALLLLDEPLSALDRNLRGATRTELVRLQRQLGMTFVMVTHDQEEALTMAHRIGVMHEGRLAQVGTPAEVYERPVNRFVAEFLGAANILPAVLWEDGETLDLPGLGGCVWGGGGEGTNTPAPPTAGPVLLAIRPERLRLDGSAPNRLTGVLEDLSYAGETVTHAVRLADGSILRASASVADGIGAVRHAVGDAVTVSWQPDACIILPA